MPCSQRTVKAAMIKGSSDWGKCMLHWPQKCNSKFMLLNGLHSNLRNHLCRCRYSTCTVSGEAPRTYRQRDREQKMTVHCQPLLPKKNIWVKLMTQEVKGYWTWSSDEPLPWPTSCNCSKKPLQAAQGRFAVNRQLWTQETTVASCQKSAF